MHFLAVVGAYSPGQFKEFLLGVEGNDTVGVRERDWHDNTDAFAGAGWRGEVGKIRPAHAQILIADAGEDDAFARPQSAFSDILRRHEQFGFSDFARGGEAGIAVQIRLAAAENDVEDGADDQRVSADGHHPRPLELLRIGGGVVAHVMEDIERLTAHLVGQMEALGEGLAQVEALEAENQAEGKAGRPDDAECQHGQADDAEQYFEEFSHGGAS